MSQAPVLAPAPTITPPRLLIEWSSPWEEFLSAIRPAFGKSGRPLAGEARTGLFPYRGMVAGWALEAIVLLAAVTLPGRLFVSTQPIYTPVFRPNEDVIYFSGEELPRTEDLGGAQTGKSGRAGGHESYHRTQTIHVARGDSPTDKIVDVPKLNIPKSDLPVANLLAINRTPGPPPTSGLRSTLPALPQPTIVPPTPDIAADKIRSLPNSATAIIAPPPDVRRTTSRNTLALNAGVVAPAPQVQGTATRSLPNVNAGVVAPAPDVRRDQVPTTASAGLNPDVVPPSPFTPRAVGGVRIPQMGTEVVPPPVSAPVNTTSSRTGLSLPQPGVVAPPPSQIAREGVATSRGGQIDSSQASIVPPPVQLGTSAGSGVRGGGVTTAANVVPPAPTVAASASAVGKGRAGSAAGLGNPADAVAPPSAAGGTSNKAGVVISSQPGSRFAVPGNGSTGSIAMSPNGGAKPGLGGSGGGNGIGRGNGPGSGLDGEGSGASKTGTGRGSEVMAKGGTSPFPGSGGAGKSPGGTSAAPGISVVGGNTINLPSFGSGAGGGPDITDATRVHGPKSGPGITVVATSRSGGAFNFYGTLKGDKVYTIYIDTAVGTAVLQYADPTSAGHAYADELTAPQPLRANVPAGLSRSRLVIACILDKSGILKNVHVLEGNAADMNAKVVAALATWKFQPAQRGTQPVEVNAILGFNIDTRR
jgi:hypothetical protein